ncbi:MAG: hypothetical protein ACRBB4_05895 [Neptuniibacter sp.]|uniref:hypothetical protein n=1 Tax=Neptuniibacter sp. TaxID=1962643 RepID=UPI003B5A4749
MTIELRSKVNALKNKIEQRENAARETAHRIARAQATYNGVSKPETASRPKQELVEDQIPQANVRVIEATETQTRMIEEVIVIAKLAEDRAFKAEKKALTAQREAMFSNVISLVTMTIAIAIFINIGLG